MLRGVLPLKEKGWWKFLSLSVLSDYFVYRKVIYTFTNYNLPQISLDRCYYTSNTYLHLSCPYRRRQLKEGNMAFSFMSKKTTFSTSTPKAFSVWKNWLFAFLFRFVCEPRFLQERKLSGEPRISYLRGGEMETNSAADRLLQPNGSFYLRKVFGINNMSRLSDYNSVKLPFPTVKRLFLFFTTKTISFPNIISWKKLRTI